MSDYWIKCNLDVKENIQQYLKYNMLQEMKEFNKLYLKDIFGCCFKCCKLFDYCDIFILISRSQVVEKHSYKYLRLSIICQICCLKYRKKYTGWSSQFIVTYNEHFKFFEKYDRGIIPKVDKKGWYLEIPYDK